MTEYLEQQGHFPPNMGLGCCALFLICQSKGVCPCCACATPETTLPCLCPVEWFKYPIRTKFLQAVWRRSSWSVADTHNSITWIVLSNPGHSSSHLTYCPPLDRAPCIPTALSHHGQLHCMLFQIVLPKKPASIHGSTLNLGIWCQCTPPTDKGTISPCPCTSSSLKHRQLHPPLGAQLRQVFAVLGAGEYCVAAAHPGSPGHHALQCVTIAHR